MAKLKMKWTRSPGRMDWAFNWVRAMIKQTLKIATERLKMFLEFATKTFPEAEVKEINLPGIENSDVGEIAIRLNKPNSRSIILKPSRPLMTDTNVKFLQIFLDGIQTAKKLLGNPPLKEQDFQGTILHNDKGVEIFLKAEKTDSVHL
jgi:hypothetical protein